MVSSNTIKNPTTEKRKKFITSLYCHVGRNNRDLIRNIVTRFGGCKRELTILETAQES